MKQILKLILSITLISFTFQINCGSYSDSTCEYHTTKYNTKCQMISSNCQQIEVDDGCEITSAGVCQETSSIESGSKCYNFGKTNRCKKVKIDEGCKIDANFQCTGKTSLESTETCRFADVTKQNYCQKVTKTCTDYNDDTCGNLKKIEGTKQCIQMTSNSYCSEIIIDEYCGIKDDNDKKCQPRIDNFDSNNYICKLNYNSDSKQTECKRRKKVCTDNTSNCNNFNANCHSLRGYSTCNEVEIDTKCKIDDNGECVGDTGKQFDSDIEECQLITTTEDGNSKYKCKIQTKSCSSITNTEKCSKGSIAGGTGYSCLKAGSNACKEFKVNQACSINDSGSCEIKDNTATNKACQFSDQYNTICRLYEEETNCKIHTTYGTCGDDTGDNAPPATKKCDFEYDETAIYSYCKKRDKKCEDYTQDDCDTDTTLKTTSKKCSWDREGNKCREFGIDNYCTVTNGVCDKITAETNLPDGQACLFDSVLKLECKSRSKICTNYLDSCETEFPLKDNENTQCLQIDPTNKCKSVTIDEYCKVQSTASYGTTYFRCVPRKEFAQKVGICSFDDAEKKNSCTLKARKCTEYTDNTCQDIENCIYSNNKCYETDSSCTVNDSIECTPRTGITLNNKEKCAFDYSDGICKKVNKECGDLDDSTDDKKCSIIERTSTEQCYKLSGRTSCNIITLDGYCYVNNNECVKDPNGKLNEDREICEFNYDKTTCSKREKTCSDFNSADTCNAYVPEEMKLCFYFSDSNICKEVELDDRCSMSEDSVCQGDNCKFNNDKTKCYYEKNSGNYLKIGRMIILALFFCF